jgi:Ca2+/Na+ antiporter
MSNLVGVIVSILAIVLGLYLLYVSVDTEDRNGLWTSIPIIIVAIILLIKCL